MKLADYALFSVQKTLQVLGSSLDQGLLEQQIAKLQKTYGLNTLPRHASTWWHILLRQFSSSFIHLLFLAATLSFFLQNHLNGIMILLITLVTTLLGFYQEYYAEKTVQLLTHYLMQQCKVRRNGKEIIIGSTQLVPGDIIFLVPGDILPADVRFVQTQGITIDESTLSGESAPVIKSIELEEGEKHYFTPATIGLCGTTIVDGKAMAAVIATGIHTKFSTIATLANNVDRPSIFSLEIANLSRFIAMLVVATLIGIFILHLIISGIVIPPVDLALFMIALAVSMVPQAMPAVLTFALSQGARAMARHSVIVKRLAAIEDLGSITVLCTDKTGTITENMLAVSSIFSDDQNKTLLYALQASDTTFDKKNGSSHSFDYAVFRHAQEIGLHLSEKTTSIETIPFSTLARCNGVLLSGEHGDELIIRGAYEQVLKNCNPQTIPTAAYAWGQEEGKRGNRVIGIATKKLSIAEKSHDYLQETGLAFSGLISFVDPIKESTYQAIKEAQLMGVKIKVLTGDALEVAVTVAQSIGLMTSSDQVMLGDDFVKLSVSEQKKACEIVAVFARTLPEQKFQIIKTLATFERVGFLGEGINDVPSLKSTLVAIVVENSTDIAKDAADIILLKKSLLVIIDGIKEGRKIFTNTLTYFQGMLTSNFSRFYAVALASFFIDYLPMLPLQIILINFLSDLPLIFIATDNVDPCELDKPRHYQIKELISFGMILGGVCFAIDFFFFAHFVKHGPDVLRTNWFIFTILSELVFFCLIRTKHFFLTAVQPTFLLIALTLTSAGITIALPFTHYGAAFFEFVPPLAQDLVWMSGLLVVFLIIMECSKLLYWRIFHASDH